VSLRTEQRLAAGGRRPHIRTVFPQNQSQTLYRNGGRVSTMGSAIQPFGAVPCPHAYCTSAYASSF
jgi:hypothetical protein